MACCSTAFRRPRPSLSPCLSICFTIRRKPKHANPPVAKPQTVKLDRPRPPDPPPLQELAEQVPVISSAEPVAPPPPGAPAGIETPSEPAPPLKPAGPVILSGDLAVSCPERAAPAYPLISRRLGEEGKTVLRVELDESGLIDRAAVKTSSGYARLDDAALTAVKHWRCKPVKRDGILGPRGCPAAFQICS